MAHAALAGAVEQIKKLGGGRIEGYLEDTEGRKASPAFLLNGALSTFEGLGFERSRLIGKHCSYRVLASWLQMSGAARYRQL